MKKLFFMALVGSALFSCGRPDVNGPEGGETQKVSITITKEAMSRSTLGYSVPEGAVTALESGKLFFFNGGGVAVHTYTLSAADIAAKSFIVENIPAAAASVAMIANAPAELASAAPASFTAFKTLTLGIDPQASMAGATGATVEGVENYPNAVKGVALIDRLGTEGAANALVPVSGRSYTHTASIKLAPAVARIEIAPGAIKVAASNSKNLKDFDFTGIYVNNYSPTLALGMTPAGTLFGSTILNGGSSDWYAAYMALTPSAHLWNEPEAAATVTTTDGAGGYAYHIFPGAVPHIVLKGTNFDYGAAGTVASTQYWIVDKYWNVDGQEGDPGYVAGKGSPITNFDAGYVYKIASIMVGGTHPHDDPYDDPVSVQVTLTVEPWHVTNVYVEPE